MDIRTRVINSLAFLQQINTVKAAPIGATIAKGTTFQGAFNGGSQSDPDIVANPDQISYELTPPTGYANAALYQHLADPGTYRENSGRHCSTISGLHANQSRSSQW
jgi:hypothetical protein